jgi:hypothetical protein
MVLRVLAVVLFVAASVSAQTDPRTLPLVQPADVTYTGAIPFVPYAGTEQERMDYGGHALGVGDGALYVGGHAWFSRLARISYPPPGGIATVQIKPTPVPDLASISPAGIGGPLGGTLLHENRLIVTAYVYYDADTATQQTRSHFTVNPDLTDWRGPFRVQPTLGSSGFVSGYMASIPPEWRELFGGPALTGQSSLPIISRTSLGPTASVFDPAQLGVVDPVPATTLLGYDLAHWLPAGFGHFSTMTIVGMAFPSGTRSLLFLARLGAGGQCYGPGTTDQSLHGTPDGQGNVYCFDPVYPDKGYHAFPYRHGIIAYDANEALKVKAGEKKPWEVTPYATWMLPGTREDGRATVRSAAYDPATRRILLTEDYGSTTPRIHVWTVAGGTGETEPPPPPPPPPPPGGCEGTWSAWTPTSEWTECPNSGGAQSRDESRVFTVTKEPDPGGLACPVPLTETRIATQPCEDVCVSTPLVIRVTRWPSQPTGKRQGEWDSGSFYVTSARFVFTPQPDGSFTRSFEAIDRRGCTATVVKP